MTARKCDRCNNFYDTDAEQDFDLCPDCTADFELWISNKAIILERQEVEEWNR